MASSPDLKPLSSTDVDFAWSLYSETTRPHIEPLLKSGWNDAEQRKSFLGWWLPENTLLISVEGSPVGWISTVSKDGKLTLEHLCISPAYQGQGIGKFAIEHVIEKQSHGHNVIEAHPLKGSSLIRHLEAIGFRISDEVVDDPLTVGLLKQ
jgi:GNAT superfamily N-acetyltransferase